MRKVKNYLKIGLLLIGVLLTTVNCEKEKIEEELSVSDTVINDLFETVSIEESKEFFINRKLKNLEARVYDPIELEPDLSRISQEEILNTSTKITVIPATTIHQDIETRILQVKSNTGEIHSLLFNEIPDVSNSNSSYFSGIISLTTLSGDFIEGFRVEDGNAVSEFVVQSGTLGDCNESLNPNSIFCNQQLQEIFLGSQSIVTINSYTSQSFNQGPVYQSYIWRYNNNGYYGYAQGYMNYLRKIAIKEFDDRIIDKNLDLCLKSIMNSLKKLMNTPGNMVSKFSNNSPGYNWSVESGSLAGQATASTSAPAFYNSNTGVTTVFDSQGYLDATNLSWARTILHESIHAYLATYYKINRPNWLATYPQMVQDWGTLQNWNDVHHEEIARSLVTLVASALEEYGNVNGYNLSQQFYEDMAWAGLQDTSTFRALSLSDQKRILDVISVELTGKDTNGLIKSQKGVKAGC